MKTLSYQSNKLNARVGLVMAKVEYLTKKGFSTKIVAKKGQPLTK
ncbi:hypothetical protein [Tenacibaculum sp. IB213877]|nr:hypothetical protein [Tenacibaculum sp. IB213877]MDY0780117.1 hypothetical protein [Tenacibaculum sp. IB213877]